MDMGPYKGPEWVVRKARQLYHKWGHAMALDLAIRNVRFHGDSWTAVINEINKMKDQGVIGPDIKVPEPTHPPPPRKTITPLVKEEYP